GGGRNYIANDPSKIPQIFLRETRTVARLGIVPGKFFPQELSANPMVRDLRRVAPLYGYIATTPKPAAEIVLASTRLDPVLAAWQYGLGRSVAWTSDAAGLWTKDWLRVPNANRFWANLASWVLPAAGTNQLFISGSSSQGQGHISVTMPPSVGANPGVTAHILTPGLQTTTIQLEPSSPGQFGGSFQEGAQGAYFVTVEARGAGHAEAGQIGMDVPYSPEYRSTGLNLSFLRSLAAAGGGSIITHPQDAWKGNLQPVLAEYDVTLWLLLLAVLLLPVDVGVRRLVVSRRELAAILEALPFRRTAYSDREAINPVVGALRRRRSQRDSFAPEAIAEARAFAVPPRISPSNNRRMDGRISPSGSSTPSVRSSDVSAATVQGHENADEESVASKLLAAKRNKG
ncbi:MAG TPA: glutamine amidotransferase, partial [Chloroflexota bacterium]